MVPGAASGVHDVLRHLLLLLLLLPLFIRCPRATAIYVLLLSCSAATVVPLLCFLHVFAADPRMSMVIVQLNFSR